MALTANKLILTDGAPAGGEQDMRSSTWGVDGSENLENANYKISPAAGIIGDVLQITAPGVASLAPVKTSQTLTITTSTVLTNQDFVNNVIEDNEPYITINDGIAALKISIAATTSFKENRPIKV